MISAKNIDKSYYNNNVLDNVSLEIEEGKITTLLGANGSGKSTLLNILAGAEFPDKGIVSYKDIALSKINFPYKHDIFYVQEKLNYIVPMTIGEYIDLIKEKIPRWNEVLFKKMIKDREINLNKSFQSFSRGQKMQIALIIGISSSPKVLLLDEITSVIDVHGRKYFLDLIEKFANEGNSVVITTNVINELEFYTDNLIVLKEKKIIFNKSLKDIKSDFVKLIRQKDNEHEVFSHESCIWAGVNSDRSVSYIIPVELYDQMEISHELLDRRIPTLEDVFIYHVGHSKGMVEHNEDVA